MVTKLSNVAILLSGRDLASEVCNEVKDGIPYLIGASNIENNKLKFVRWTKTPKVISINNDILLSCKGTIGEIALNQYGEVHIARQFMAIRCGKAIMPHYLLRVLQAQLTLIRKRANGIIPGISRPVLLDLDIPLPPLAEQSRILNILQIMEIEFESINNILN